MSISISKIWVCQGEEHASRSPMVLAHGNLPVIITVENVSDEFVHTLFVMLVDIASSQIRRARRNCQVEEINAKYVAQKEQFHRMQIHSGARVLKIWGSQH